MITRKTLVLSVGGVAAAAVFGTAGVAMAASSAPATPSPSTAASTSAPAADDQTGDHTGARTGLRARLGRALHGEVVVRGKDGKPVTVIEARGQVTAVSPTAITIRTEDGVMATFAVNDETRVRVKGAGHQGAIGDVKVGDHAIAVGVKNGATVTARGILTGLAT
jgi:hypothetical protein